MLSTRIWMGSILVAAGLLIIFVDEAFAPWYPGWFLLLISLGIITCREMLFLVRQDHLVSAVLCHAGIIMVLSANWLIHVLPPNRFFSAQGNSLILAWQWIFLVFFVYFFALFLAEMAIFRRPSGAMIRMALSVWIITYLGLLPSFLAQLRWLPLEYEGRTYLGTTAVLMTIFVPKCCDIGAYFSGRLFGRTRMTPQLSPKKTWEGAVGGLILAIVLTIIIDRLSPAHLLNQNVWLEIGFGVTVGGAGILGDLGESLIKREYQQKDASQAVPGFGGVLDVVDAVLFASPVAYLWFLFLVSPI